MAEQTPGTSSLRNLIVADIVERTGINDDMINRLVRAFYARARLDPLLGPIFDHNVGDWEAHFARMGDFWSSVALMSGRYHGQPIAAHFPLPVDTRHFNRWLELFAAARAGDLSAAGGRALHRARPPHRRQSGVRDRCPEG